MPLFRRTAVSAPAGDEPDYRFTLANERTFLAWVRTALALDAAGLAVLHLLPVLVLPGARELLGLALVGLGAVVAVDAPAVYMAAATAAASAL